MCFIWSEVCLRPAVLSSNTPSETVAFLRPVVEPFSLDEHFQSSPISLCATAAAPQPWRRSTGPFLSFSISVWWRPAGSFRSARLRETRLWGLVGTRCRRRWGSGNLFSSTTCSSMLFMWVKMNSDVSQRTDYQTVTQSVSLMWLCSHLDGFTVSSIRGLWFGRYFRFKCDLVFLFSVQKELYIRSLIFSPPISHFLLKLINIGWQIMG